MATRRALVLLRCSTDKQDTDFAAQRADLERYIATAGLVVAADDWREEAAVSGAAASRPVLDRIREEAEAGTVSHLLTADFDRLGRAGEETLWIVRQLVDGCKVEVVIVRHPTVDLRTLQGRLMLFALAMAGLCKLDTVSKSTKAAFVQDESGVTRSRRHGKKVGNPAFAWSPEVDAELLVLADRGLSAQEIAESGIVVPRRRAVDEDGRLPASVPKGERKPAVRFVEMLEAPKATAVKTRLRTLRAQEPKRAPAL